MASRFPAYGARLWQRRLLGERTRVVALLVGESWRLPGWWPAECPRVAVRTSAWHESEGERFDWRVVAGCVVFAFDNRGPHERIETADGWDPWLWLLAGVLRYSDSVLMYTIMEKFIDPPGGFAAERWLDVWAFLHVRYEGTRRIWPPWWPYGEQPNGRPQ